jgi:hypothetical protein
MIMVRYSPHFLQELEVLEGRLAIDHLVQDNAERPHIGRSSDFEATHAIRQFDGFGTHVVDRANLSRSVSKPDR